MSTEVSKIDSKTELNILELFLFGSAKCGGKTICPPCPICNTTVNGTKLTAYLTHTFEWRCAGCSKLYTKRIK